MDSKSWKDILRWLIQIQFQWDVPFQSLFLNKVKGKYILDLF